MARRAGLDGLRGPGSGPTRSRPGAPRSGRRSPRSDPGGLAARGSGRGTDRRAIDARPGGGRQSSGSGSRSNSVSGVRDRRSAPSPLRSSRRRPGSAAFPGRPGARPSRGRVLDRRGASGGGPATALVVAVGVDQRRRRSDAGSHAPGPCRGFRRSRGGGVRPGRRPRPGPGSSRASQARSSSTSSGRRWTRAEIRAWSAASGRVVRRRARALWPTRTIPANAPGSPSRLPRTRNSSRTPTEAFWPSSTIRPQRSPVLGGFGEEVGERRARSRPARPTCSKPRAWRIEAEKLALGDRGAEVDGGPPPGRGQGVAEPPADPGLAHPGLPGQEHRAAPGFEGGGEPRDRVGAAREDELLVRPATAPGTLGPRDGPCSIHRVTFPSRLVPRSSGLFRPNRPSPHRDSVGRPRRGVRHPGGPGSKLLSVTAPRGLTRNPPPAPATAEVAPRPRLC